MSFPRADQSLRIPHLHAQPDEGYSEDTQSLIDDELEDAHTIKPLTDAAHALLRSLESLSLEDRLSILKFSAGSLPPEQQLALLKDVLFGLPTWAKQDASSHLDSLMFFDPVQHFPYEIVQNILGHLNPRELLSASAVSRDWRIHTQDEELWKACFRREGWRVDKDKIRSVEASAHHDPGFTRRDSRKKRRLDNPSSRAALHLAHTEDEMEDIEVAIALPSHARRASLQSNLSMMSGSTSGMDTQFRLKPTIMQSRMGNSFDGQRISWAWMYKQRRLLERNWEQGHYQMFRLPHPKYEHEGHAECVYTIQHVGNILVSGSRDRTIRRWDLDTCRLKGPPLSGHSASVLCLQFDPTPENDIIVSGGSDSWVIIWRFSTGEILKKMTTAHTESVLNLRFDDRYIVTCSKDKTIKIWNRRTIAVSDSIVPDHVLPRFQNVAPEMPIKAFSLLTVLQGHKAAVNAVMIHNDRIVSASGDREIKAWSINSGRCEKTYTGHTKGIACVQYDGRRIVSGSSDNTVRIFDAEQQAEVACLLGHSNLVRTVQARFGDLEVISDEELHKEARRADMKWYKAMAMGAPSASGSRRAKRNPGSSRPEDVLTIGAKVPHGGGGTRWARIVSGSYDETVIIWRKDQDGKWTARHKLNQDMLVKHRVRISRPPVAPGQVMPGAFPPQNVLAVSSSMSPPEALPSAASPQHSVSPAASDTAVDATAISTQMSTLATDGSATGSPAQGDAVRSQPDQAQASSQAAAAAARPAAAPQPSPSLHAMQPAPRDSNRVFKLQFDTRRIVCCSQNKIIVGWDFAAGNEDLARVGTWCEETY